MTGNPKFEISWFAISLFDNREGPQAIVIRSRKVKNSLSEQTSKRASDYPRRDRKNSASRKGSKKGPVVLRNIYWNLRMSPLGNNFFTHVFFIVLYLL